MSPANTTAVHWLQAQVRWRTSGMGAVAETDRWSSMRLSITTSSRPPSMTCRRRAPPDHVPAKTVGPEITAEYVWNIARARTHRAHPSDDRSSRAASCTRSRSARRRCSRSASEGCRRLLIMVPPCWFGPPDAGPVPPKPQPPGCKNQSVRPRDGAARRRNKRSNSPSHTATPRTASRHRAKTPAIMRRLDRKITSRPQKEAV